MAAPADITIYVPSALREYCGGRDAVAVPAPTVRAALDELERRHPRLYTNLCDETGAVRRHLNIFVNTSNVRDGGGLETALEAGDVVTILTAVSGG
jgi:MoaD family protein